MEREGRERGGEGRGGEERGEYCAIIVFLPLSPMISCMHTGNEDFQHITLYPFSAALKISICCENTTAELEGNEEEPERDKQRK